MKEAKEFKSNFPMNVCYSHIFDDSLWYVVRCDCGRKECAADIEIEVDKYGIMILSFYKKLFYDCWSDSIWAKFKHRVKGILKLIFNGYLEVEESLVISDVKHIDAFIDALFEARNHLNIVLKNRDAKG